VPNDQPGHYANGGDQRILYSSRAQRSGGQTKSDLASDLLSDRPLYETAIWTQYLHKFSPTDTFADSSISRRP